jgi:uncharacterized protein YodC (DUF2158 family)
MFEIGDKVRLKSGGPLMVIQNLGDYSPPKNGAECVWFDDKKVVQKKVFDTAVLEKDDA